MRTILSGTVVLLASCFVITIAEVDEKELAKTIQLVAKQLERNQMSIEEVIRRDGNSGLQKIRQRHDGTRPYQIETLTEYRMMLMHDHNDHRGTLGLGEIALDINGVYFRTRHNDYSIVMPSTKSKEYGAVEEVPFPEVPPEVLAKPTVEEQIEEMQLWFKAFYDQDHSVRDYRKYFQPLMCYVEGAWTLPDEDSLDELTPSSRHRFKADNFKQLHNIASFNAYSGHQDNGENFAYLPTKMLVLNKTTPVSAQWNYRVLCHPIKKIFLKTNHLRVVDDFFVRLSNSMTLEELARKPTARFELNAEADDQFYEGTYIHGLLDEIMEEIPGLDNYRGNLQDDTYNQLALHVVKDTPINAAYYHRWYKVDDAGPMGDFIRHKGFNDKHIFFAMNSQDKVAPIEVEHLCKTDSGKKSCEYKSKQRWSYAIPLEVVYLTPLGKWNPYDIEYKGYHGGRAGKTVNADGRKGGLTKSTAFNGTNSKTFYHTPAGFFKGTLDPTPADTVKNGAVGVLNKKGEVCKVYASGTTVLMPPIPGVEHKIRTRYPVIPIAADGQTVYKELAALKEYLFNPNAYPKIQNETLSRSVADSSLPPTHGIYQMGYADNNDANGQAPHSHIIRLSTVDLRNLVQKERELSFTTSGNLGHSHEVKVAYSKSSNAIVYSSCDGNSKCPDNHGNTFVHVKFC